MSCVGAAPMGWPWREPWFRVRAQQRADYVYEQLAFGRASPTCAMATSRPDEYADRIAVSDCDARRAKSQVFAVPTAVRTFYL